MKDPNHEVIFTRIIYLLWFISIITAFYIIYAYISTKNTSLSYPLLGAFGILISAMLASVTVARAYAQNERFKENEKNNNEFQIKKFAILAALEVFYPIILNNDNRDIALNELKTIKSEYSDRIEKSSELLKDVYEHLYLAIEILYDNLEINENISKIITAQRIIITEADQLQIKHLY